MTYRYTRCLPVFVADELELVGGGPTGFQGERGSQDKGILHAQQRLQPARFRGAQGPGPPYALLAAPPAWSAPVVALAATAPAYAASSTFGGIIGGARWEWGNPSSDWLGARTHRVRSAGGRTIQANDLQIKITAPNRISIGALCGLVDHHDGIDYAGGSVAADWDFNFSTTGSSRSDWRVVMTFTYKKAIVSTSSFTRPTCVTLGFNLDVDTNECALRITQTPQMSYTVSAPASGYSPVNRIVWHTNDTV